MISWSAYVELVLLGLGAYYVLVLVRVFPGKIRSLFVVRDPEKASSTPAGEEAGAGEEEDASRG